MSLPADLENALASGQPAGVLHATLDHFQCQTGTIHVMKDGLLSLVAQANLPEALLPVVQTVPVGKGIAGLAAERRMPISLCNLQTDESGQARPAARSTGMEGAVAVPMMLGEELRGVFGIAKATAHDWTDAEKAELLGIAARLAERI